jgi:hypothetical protein
VSPLVGVGHEPEIAESLLLTHLGSRQLRTAFIRNGPPTSSRCRVWTVIQHLILGSPATTTAFEFAEKNLDARSAWCQHHFLPGQFLIVTAPFERIQGLLGADADKPQRIFCGTSDLGRGNNRDR